MAVSTFCLSDNLDSLGWAAFSLRGLLFVYLIVLAVGSFYSFLIFPYFVFTFGYAEETLWFKGTCSFSDWGAIEIYSFLISPAYIYCFSSEVWFDRRGIIYCPLSPPSDSITTWFFSLRFEIDYSSLPFFLTTFGTYSSCKSTLESPFFGPLLIFFVLSCCFPWGSLFESVVIFFLWLVRPSMLAGLDCRFSISFFPSIYDDKLNISLYRALFSR